MGGKTQEPCFSKENFEPKLEFPEELMRKEGGGGGRFKPQKPFVGGVWRFSGKIHITKKLGGMRR